MLEIRSRTGRGEIDACRYCIVKPQKSYGAWHYSRCEILLVSSNEEFVEYRTRLFDPQENQLKIGRLIDGYDHSSMKYEVKRAVEAIHIFYCHSAIYYEHGHGCGTRKVISEIPRVIVIILIRRGIDNIRSFLDPHFPMLTGKTLIDS